MNDRERRRTLSRSDKAKLLLRKARRQLELASKGIALGSDDIAITFLFQACENAVRAAAKATGEFPDTKAHYDLSSQAEELADQGFVQSDVSERLDELNTGRKRAAYGYEETFEHDDLTAVATELQAYLAEVDALIRRDGEKRNQ